MTASKGVLSQISRAISDNERYPPKKSWFSRLSKPAQTELEDVKRRFLAGEYEGVPLVVIYRGVAARCREARWEVPKSATTVTRWLRS
jgi:hypothetical protein